MSILKTPGTIKNPPEQFAGDVWVDMLAYPMSEAQRAVMAKVRFAPGARTAWHHHARGQYLHVTEGVAYFGDRDGNVIEVKAGETLYTPPGEEHYHYASPKTFMEHIALLEGEDPKTSTVWLEHVEDKDLPTVE
ncbi:cupin domain-containing protein [Demequina zhanjiangensis]|uniref:Cupin domain-containing protein n=1 Tax=Demequina zhanjiangensis TaxID=3051659 RepID=A0ABT8G0C4_9MICO|nr:cupin domain-containing protein [Demequina sp. SYSU T00b26]MDN4472590.1 cupin domain-containing protein [Demequina sp. SYSU T00b26]